MKKIINSNLFNKEQTFRFFSHLVNVFRFYWLLYLICIVAAFFSAATEIASGHIIKTITDSALKQESQRILTMIFFTLAVIIIGIVARYILKVTSGIISHSVLCDLRNQAYQVIQNLQYTKIENTHTGDFTTRMNSDINTVKEFYQTSLVDLLYQPLVFIGCLIYLIFLNWQLTLASVILIPFSIYLSHLFTIPMEKQAKRVQEGLAESNAIAKDMVGGISIVKSYGLYITFFKKYENVITSKWVKGMLDRQKLIALRTPLFMTTYILPLIITIGYGGYLVFQQKITAGILFAFIFLLHYLIDGLQIIPDIITQSRIVKASLIRILEIIQMPEERTNGSIFSENNNNPLIELQNIFFSYSEKQKVFRGLNLSIEKAKVIAIAGESGSGKSTLFKLLCGFYEPEKGKMLLYGKNYKNWSLFGIRNLISLVSQDTYLFPATIEENILCGKPGAGKEEMLNSAKLANADEFINQFPDGYLTVVGERGNRLSGGQRQRIELARAFLKNAPILLLDEPTSALDSHSEFLIKEAIERIMQDKTVIVIAHRYSTIKNADLIMVMDQGVISETGTHNELLEKKGKYYELYMKQFADNEISTN